MWIITFFDLPTKTKKNKTAYRKFRDFLLKDGFTMLQYSVYARPCSTPEDTSKHTLRVQAHLQDEGEVRIISLTASQFAKMKSFFGKSPSNVEKEPDQLTIFD